MNFEERYISKYIFLTDQISLPNCFYLLRYCIICLLQLFVVQSIIGRDVPETRRQYVLRKKLD